MKFRALKKRGITEEDFVQICNDSLSVSKAMIKTNLHRRTFEKYSKYLNCYFPNQGLKGGTKNIPTKKISINDWNNDVNIEVTRCALRKWILKLKLLPLKCNKCGLEKWLNVCIPLELNHINGNGNIHKKSNIELICPNCHALTDTYRGKNIK